MEGGGGAVPTAPLRMAEAERSAIRRGNSPQQIHNKAHAVFVPEMHAAATEVLAVAARFRQATKPKALALPEHGVRSRIRTARRQNPEETVCELLSAGHALTGGTALGHSFFGTAELHRVRLTL